MRKYRTHTCGELRRDSVGEDVRLSGWVHRKRDHGGLLFVDLRDHYGVTQCVAEAGGTVFDQLDAASPESVITVTGGLVLRSEDTINPAIPTGEVEVRIADLAILSSADELPLQVFGDHPNPEDLRLRYRYLDLRRQRLHDNIMLRSRVIASIRRRMLERGFNEFQTPILTASSPEGARDFLVPSRLHPGRFYALPQAPQLFKQLVMAAGFDRYFQIAPCFRDEDARADRSPGEFYQLDVEMSFVEQEDVFAAVEPVLHGVFAEFSSRRVTPMPFPRIPYAEATLKYGTDKPDLRNPIEIADVSEAFRGSNFRIFATAIARGAVARAIPAPGAASQPRSFFDRMNEWARAEGAAGLGYIVFAEDGARGPIAKQLDDARLDAIRSATGAATGDAVFFACAAAPDAASLAGSRAHPDRRASRFDRGGHLPLLLGDRLSHVRARRNRRPPRIQPQSRFSMPQGGLEALATEDPLTILSHQYDVVCNGVELSSGAIRNHLPEVMYKAFEIAGYGRDEVEKGFGGLLGAMRYGAPPHGGIAPGIDRIVMLIADEPNIREVIMFPMNQRAEDLMMGAPAPVSERHLKELHVRLALPAQPKD